MSGFALIWTATIFAANVTMTDVNVVDFDRMSYPPFKSQRACEAYAYKNAPKMATLIAEYFNNADVGIRWKCVKQ